MSVVTLTDYQPTERFDGNAWTSARIEGSASSGGPWATVETIELDPVDADPKEPATRNFTTAQALTTQTWFRVVFVDDDDNELPTEPTTILRPAFASVADVEVRAGRDLTDGEQAMAEQVLLMVSGLIATTVGKDLEWVVDLDPVPAVLKQLTIEKAMAAILNPTGAAVTSETLGKHTYSQTFPRQADAGVFLTAAEERAARIAVYGGKAAGSVAVESMIDDLPLDWNQGGWPASGNGIAALYDEVE
jgi:hypothetical protein